MLGACGGSTKPPAGSVAVTLSRPLPRVTVRDHIVQIKGIAPGAPAGARATLESEAPEAHWSTLASTAVRSSHFTIIWLPTKNEKATMRVSVSSGGRLLASSASGRVAVGTGPEPCQALASPVVVKKGEGALVGGVYISEAGMLGCEQHAYVLTATNAAGAVVATQHVPARQYYALVLRAGTYTLAASVCGAKTVAPVKLLAGKAHREDLICKRR
jgi:hypothetical protein